MPNNNPQQTTPQQQISRAADSATKAAERLESQAENATQIALDKVRQVREDAESGILQQRDQVAGRIRRLGDVLRSGSSLLRQEDPVAQQLFDTASDSIERVADYVGTVTPGQIASDVQTLARRSPALFFGGTFILGLALGRFAKSTAGALDTTEWEDAPRPPPRRKRQGNTQRASTQSGGQRQQSLPHGVSSSEPGTIGTGTGNHPAVNAPPSYGATSSGASPSTVTRSAESASAKPKAVDQGEGSKS